MTAATALHQQFCSVRSFIKYEVLIVDHFSVLTDPFGSAHGKFRLDMVVMMTYDKSEGGGGGGIGEGYAHLPICAIFWPEPKVKKVAL